MRKKRIVCILLCVILLLGMLPMPGALAAIDSLTLTITNMSDITLTLTGV